MMRPGQTLIDMSTAPPALMRKIAADLRGQGLYFADAPSRARAAPQSTVRCRSWSAARADFRAHKADPRHHGQRDHPLRRRRRGQVVEDHEQHGRVRDDDGSRRGALDRGGRGIDGKLLLETMGKGSADSFVSQSRHEASAAAGLSEERFSVRYAKDLPMRAISPRPPIKARGADLVATLFDEAIASGDGDRYTPVIRRLMKDKRELRVFLPRSANAFVPEARLRARRLLRPRRCLAGCVLASRSSIAT